MANPARQPDALVSWMESLSDPTRLRLLRVLERHELGVAEICGVVQLPQSTVSRHLKVLGDQGWVHWRADGTTRLYRTADDREPGPRRLWAVAREETSGWATVRQDQLRLSRILARRRPATQAFFAGAAGRWDRLREEVYGREFEAQALLGLLPSRWVVADLGCGTGGVAAALAPHVGRVVGVDQSTAMLRAASRRTAALGNVELRQGSLEAVPLEDASADGVLLILALAYVAEPPRALREARRILRPAGSVVVVDLLKHDREDFRRQMGQASLGFEIEEFAGVMAATGFEDVSVRALTPEAGAKGPALLCARASRSGGVVDLETARQTLSRKGRKKI